MTEKKGREKEYYEWVAKKERKKVYYEMGGTGLDR